MKKYLTNKTHILYGMIFSTASSSKTYGGEWDDSEDIEQHVIKILNTVISKPIRITDIIHAHEFISITIAIQDSDSSTETRRLVFSRTLDSIQSIIENTYYEDEDIIYGQIAVPKFKLNK